MNLTEKKISSQTVFNGKVINVRVDVIQLPDGNQSLREVVEYPGAVTVVPVTDKNEIIMVRQYRHAVGKILLELPAGKMEKGEQPITSARRELCEETGYTASDIKKLFSFYTTPGFTTEEMHLFIAGGLTYTGGKPDEDEFFQLEHVPLCKAVELIKNGEICDAKSIVGIFAALEAYPDLLTGQD